MKKLIILALVLAGCSPDSGEAGHKQSEESGRGQPKVYNYEPSLSTLQGELRTERFWGPPGYGEDTLADSKEICTVLIPEKPINVVADSSNELDETINNIKKIQLASNIRLDPYIGKQVTISGKLFSAQTGHHHTAILLDVKKVETR